MGDVGDGYYVSRDQSLPHARTQLSAEHFHVFGTP